MATWTDLTANKAANDAFTYTLVNQMIENLNYLKTPPADIYTENLATSDITTTSTSMVDLTGFTTSVTVQRNPGVIMIVLSLRSNSTNARFDIQVDSVSITGDSNGMGAVTPASTFGNNTFVKFVQVASGAHTVKATWRVTTGTGTVYPAGLCQLYVCEVGYVS